MYLVLDRHKPGSVPLGFSGGLAQAKRRLVQRAETLQQLLPQALQRPEALHLAVVVVVLLVVVMLVVAHPLVVLLLVVVLVDRGPEP